jgi:hypothetical protein
MENVLHKYYAGKSDDVDDNDESEDVQGLYDRQPTKRYAELYDQHLDDKISNEFVSLTRTLTNDNDDDKDSTKAVRIDGRSKNIFLVPFKLLTKIDRPDDWVNTELDLISQLPEVPSLQQDGKVARELPKPIFGKSSAFKS